MKQLWMTGAAVVMACSIATLNAQTGSQPQYPQTQPPAAQATADTKVSATLKGCVYEEKDIPGRAPNVAERAGVMEDYILVTSPAPSVAGAAGTAGTTGTSGAMNATAKAFKLEKIADDQLKAVVGKMVEVTGKIDAERSDTAGAAAAGAPARDKNPASPDKIELPEFEVTSIRAIEGTCPATPDIKK